MKLAAVAIIGGGVSGSLIAVQLMRSATEQLDIHLIERSGVYGRGVAYGTGNYSALLNVPAAKMSAFPDDPKHFLRWLQASDFRGEQGQAATETSFVPRTIYGNYMSEVLCTAEHEAKRRVRLIRHNDTASNISVSSEEALVLLKSGERIRASKVVFAFGNFLPRDLPFMDSAVSSSPRYIKNPWLPRAAAPISPDDTVLIVGTGLTMIDFVLGLHAQGHTGKIYAVSKHGLLPQVHRFSPSMLPAPTVEDLPNAARELMNYIRHQIAVAQMDWRVVLDSLRAITPALWQRLPTAEKRRLLRHVQPYWEVHRHRIPPQAAAIIDAIRESGQLVMSDGRFKAIELHGQGIRAAFNTREHGAFLLDVDWVINCTGSNTNFRTVNNPLVSQLFRQGLARPDCFEVGLDAERDGALRDANGRVSTLLFTIGPTLKGILWETTAVPEIRQQAVALANILLNPIAVDRCVPEEAVIHEG